MKEKKKKKPPVPGLSEYRRLKKLLPHVENDMLWRLAGHRPTGAHPLWAQHGQALRPVIYRAHRRRGELSN